MMHTLLFLASTLALTAEAPPEWKQVAEKDGVTVWQRPVPGTAFIQFRGRAAVDAPVGRAAAVIWDFKRRPEWLQGCRVADIIDHPQPGVILVYSVTQGPPMVSDRDVLFEVRASVHVAEKTVELSFRTVEDPRKPLVPGMTRIPRMEGSYVFKQLTPERTEVTYELFADPGGSLPAWVVNMAGKDIPTQTLVGLRKQAIDGDHHEALASLQQALNWQGFAGP